MRREGILSPSEICGKGSRRVLTDEEAEENNWGNELKLLPSSEILENHFISLKLSSGTRILGSRRPTHRRLSSSGFFSLDRLRVGGEGRIQLL